MDTDLKPAAMESSQETSQPDASASLNDRSKRKKMLKTLLDALIELQRDEEIEEAGELYCCPTNATTLSEKTECFQNFSLGRSPRVKPRCWCKVSNSSRRHKFRSS